jgi:hypothetical protein
MAYGRLRNPMHPIFQDIQLRTVSQVFEPVVEDLLAARKKVLESAGS